MIRLHSNRDPQILLEQPYRGGIVQCSAGAPNEIWSYGEDVCDVLTGYLVLREKLKPYIKALMEETHKHSTPVMRLPFFDSPEQETSWTITDQCCFGPDLLIAPVVHEGMRERDIQLPEGGTWTDPTTGESYPGGQTLHYAAPLNKAPVFIREGGQYRSLLRL